MDIEIRAEAVMEGRDYLALTRFMTNGKNKNSIMMNILLLLIATVGVYADFKVNEKPTVITIVAGIAAPGAILLAFHGNLPDPPRKDSAWGSKERFACRGT